MNKKFSPDEFINALESNTLGEVLPLELPTILTVAGFVKASGDAGLKFAPARLCFTWIDIPKDIIKSVEYHGKRPCASGTYDFASLELTVPISDPIITAFAGLANAFSAPIPVHTDVPNAVTDNSLASGNTFASGHFNSPPDFLGLRIPRPQLPRPPRQVRCAACIAGYATVAAGIAYWAVTTGDVFVLQNIIWEELGIHIGADVAAAAISGASAGYIASLLCPDCR